MRKDTQSKIFATYNERMPKDEAAVIANERFLTDIFMSQYKGHLSKIRGGVEQVVEIGCNKGLMSGAVLSAFPKVRYLGIDLSPHDIEYARQRQTDSRAEFVCGDAFEQLQGRQVDAIIAKDIMEHIPKDQQESFVWSLHDALRPGGMAIVAVPNMDWLFSNHERYMDFTHEIGYTRESYFDIFRLAFGAENVTVEPAMYVFPHSWKQRISYTFVRPPLIRMMRFFLKFLGEGESNVWFEHREIVAVAVRR